MAIDRPDFKKRRQLHVKAYVLQCILELNKGSVFHCYSYIWIEGIIRLIWVVIQINKGLRRGMIFGRNANVTVNRSYIEERRHLHSRLCHVAKTTIPGRLL